MVKTLEYIVPVLNKEKYRRHTSQSSIINGYFRCLTDIGIASRAEDLPRHGKGASTFTVQIDLVDIANEEVINRTLRTEYNALSKEEYAQLSERERYRFEGREASLDRMIAEELAEANAPRTLYEKILSALGFSVYVREKHPRGRI